ncbi:MAG: four helix bundle protein [Rhodocyclaceae bacterium]
MALHSTLPIYKVAYDLLTLVTQATRDMPRDYKTSIGGRIREECVAIITLIFRANCATQKTPHLAELLERLQVAELLLRLSRDLRLIGTKHYAAAIALTDAVGKQANGWKKASSHA